MVLSLYINVTMHLYKTIIDGHIERGGAKEERDGGKKKDKTIITYIS